MKPLKSLLTLSLFATLLLAACSTDPDDKGDEGKRSLTAGIYTDTKSGYSLEIPATWKSSLDTVLNGSSFDLMSVEPVYASNVLVLRTPKNSGQTLEARMDLEASSLASNGYTILSKQVVTRDGAPVAEILVTKGNIKQKIVLFHKGSEAVLIFFSDAASRYDGNATLLGVDSSLTFL